MGSQRLWISRMDSELNGARGAWSGQQVLYLTPGGFTAGQGTLVAAMIRAAGLTPVTVTSDYAPVPLEQLALHPPATVVLGFFDRASISSQRWSPGRRPEMRRLLGARVLASLPGAILGCPAWFAADAADDLAKARRR